MPRQPASSILTVAPTIVPDKWDVQCEGRTVLTSLWHKLPAQHEQGSQPATSSHSNLNLALLSSPGQLSWLVNQTAGFFSRHSAAGVTCSTGVPNTTPATYPPSSCYSPGVITLARSNPVVIPEPDWQTRFVSVFQVPGCLQIWSG